MKTTLTLILVLSFGLSAAKAEEPPRAGERSLESIDTDVAALTQILKDSRFIRSRIVGDLSLEDTPPALYRMEGGKIDEKILESVGEAIVNAVRDSGRYSGEMPQVGQATTSFLVKSRAVLIKNSYPAVRVTETEERADLTVQLWICPDRPTALALFWLRRGGTVPPREANPDEIKIEWSTYRVLEQSGMPGETAYIYSDEIRYSLPLLKGDPRAGGDRMGFLLGNVIVEASTWTYMRGWRREPEPAAVGMMPGGYKETLDLLGSLDRYIRSVQGK
jgi:hypothetical protein